MAGERDAGVVDHALLHRRRDHGGVFAFHAAADRAIENRKHVARVRRIELAGRYGTRERHVLDARRALEKRAIADDDNVGLRREAHAELWTDAGGLAGSKCDAESSARQG